MCPPCSCCIAEDYVFCTILTMAGAERDQSLAPRLSAYQSRFGAHYCLGIAGFQPAFGSETRALFSALKIAAAVAVKTPMKAVVRMRPPT